VCAVAEFRQFKRARQLDDLWSQVERLGAVKTLISIVVGGVAAVVVGWLEKLPRWVIQGLVWIFVSLVVFIFLTLAFMLWTLFIGKVREWTAESPYRKRVAALEHELGKRTLSAEQKEKLLQAVSQKPGKVRIVAIEPDYDAEEYAQEFLDVMKAAGWQVWGIDRFYESDLSSAVEIGIALVTNTRALHAAAPTQVFADALADIGIKCEYAMEFRLHIDCCELRIGHRGEALRL